VSKGTDVVALAVSGGAAVVAACAGKAMQAAATVIAATNDTDRLIARSLVADDGSVQTTSDLDV